MSCASCFEGACCADCIQQEITKWKGIKMGAVKEVLNENAEVLQRLAETGRQEVRGVKFDSQKAPLDLLPYEALVEIAKVMGFGEGKYGTANWANGIELRRLLSASLRHIGQFNNGEDVDSESGLSHLAHAGCNILFALWMLQNRPDMDNRWTKSLNKPAKKVTEIE